MPDVLISAKGTIGGEVWVPGSKSESNRLLVLQALYPAIQIANLSTSDDTVVLQNALSKASGVIDIGHAGTAMRFLAAYFAAIPGDEVILTGSQRMRERPIGILVEGLRKLGAKLDYLDRDGYPPLRSRRNGISGGCMEIDAGISSQFVTALLLIAPAIPNGLELALTGEVASKPYLDMTLSMLEKAGAEVTQTANLIRIAKGKNISGNFIVEPDWSSASYFYSIVAMSAIGTKIKLPNYRRDSLQGDRAVAKIYESFGVTTQFSNDGIEVVKLGEAVKTFDFDFSSNPDLAQTVAATCAGLSIPFSFTGLATLRIKETDRISALATELGRLGGKASVKGNDLYFEPAELRPETKIRTYGDHRMALAFSAIGVRLPIVIHDFDVVSKSFPNFASALRAIGMNVESCPPTA